MKLSMLNIASWESNCKIYLEDNTLWTLEIGIKNRVFQGAWMQEFCPSCQRSLGKIWWQGCWSYYSELLWKYYGLLWNETVEEYVHVVFSKANCVLSRSVGLDDIDVGNIASSRERS